MEHTAEPGTVQISDDTYQRVAPLFDFEPLGELAVKGKSEPVRAYLVLGVKSSPGRLRGIGGRSAPLTGRDRELEQLKGVINTVRQGRGQIVCMIGEAGLGKSRLLTELQNYWEESADTGNWHPLYGVPFDASRPFGLFQNYARGMFGIEFDDPVEVIHEKVFSKIKAGGGDDDAVALCTVAFERVIAAKTLHDSAKEFPTEAIRQDIFDQMYPGLRGLLPRLSYSDDDRRSALGRCGVGRLMLHLLKLVDEVPVLFLCAFRPERESPAWQAKLKAETEFPHRYTEIQLRPLNADDTDQLVSNLLHIADLPTELRQLIIRKADGNPYFVEEIVHTLVDQGVVKQTIDCLAWEARTQIDDLAIPDNLQSLLMARIDRLDNDAKATLQMASVIGRSFYYRILEAISDEAMVIDQHLSARWSVLDLPGKSGGTF